MAFTSFTMHMSLLLWNISAGWCTYPARERRTVASTYTSATGMLPFHWIPLRYVLERMPHQTMLKSLYEHFKVLYEQITDKNPTLAAEHSLKQEEEVYAQTTKTTYRHVRVTPLNVTLNNRITVLGCHPLYSSPQETSQT